MKKTSILMFMIALSLLVPISTQAFSVKTDNSVYIPADETIEGNLYAAGSSITIDGTVNGDVFCAGRSVNVNGNVAGDIICAASTVNLKGEVDGSARILGETVNIQNKVSRGLQFAGALLVLEKDAEIGWDALVAGEAINIQGKIGGDLHGSAAKVDLSGEIGRDVKMKLDSGKGRESLKVTDSAVVNGNLFYEAGQSGEISSDATIGGELGFTEYKTKDARDNKADDILGWLISLFAALVVGLVLITLLKNQINKITKAITEKTAQSIGWGAVIMIITPLVCVVLLVTLIGIPLSLILVATWLISLYLAKIFTSIAIGHLINKKMKREKDLSLLWIMIIGVTAVWLITALPIIGWLLSLLAVWAGLGGMWLSFKK